MVNPYHLPQFVRRGAGNAPKEYRLATQALKKVRVFELAKTLGLETKAVLDYCRDLGYDVKNQLSSLETDQVDALKQRIAKGGRPAVAPPSSATPSATSKGREEDPHAAAGQEGGTVRLLKKKYSPSHLRSPHSKRRSAIGAESRRRGRPYPNCPREFRT